MTLDEFTAWLSSKGADKPCPICETNNWIAESTFYENENMNVLTIAHLKFFEWLPSGFWEDKKRIHNAYMLTCGNCGFIRLHNKSIVEPEDAK